MQIIPTVMEKRWEETGERLDQLKNVTKWVQIDVTDNAMVPGKSFELELLGKYEFFDKMLWDIHLMVKEPEKWIEKCMFVGASRVIGQVEMMKSAENFVKLAKDAGMEVGLGFDIETKIEKIGEEVDVVLLMGRKAGYGYFDLDERVFEKIKSAKLINDKRENKFLIAVDGGVNLNNINRLKDAGVEVIYSGGSYFDLINNGDNN